MQLPDRPDRVSRRQFADLEKEVEILTMLRHPSVVRMSPPPLPLSLSHTRTHFTLSHLTPSPRSPAFPRCTAHCLRTFVGGELLFICKIFNGLAHTVGFPGNFHQQSSRNIGQQEVFEPSTSPMTTGCWSPVWGRDELLFPQSAGSAHRVHFCRFEATPRLLNLD